MTLWVVRVLGWLVIAHGLTHAVLPLRGSTAPALTSGDWVPAGLYIIAMVGFRRRRARSLGLRPLDAAIGPLLVLSSGLSLVAISRLGDPTLWAGGAVDVALLLLGLWRGYGGWPAHPHHIAPGMCSPWRPGSRSWGTSPCHGVVPLASNMGEHA